MADPVTIGAAVGGQLAGGLLGFFGNRETNEANAQMAKENRDWQEYMSSSAHQREAADLKKAGLNRILSVNRSGASTPAGNVVPAQNELSPLGEGMSKAVSSALDARRLVNEDKLVHEDVKLKQLEQITEGTTAAKNVSTARQMDMSTKTMKAQYGKVEAEAALDEKWAAENYMLKKAAEIMGLATDAKSLVTPFKSKPGSKPNPNPNSGTREYDTGLKGYTIPVSGRGPASKKKGR